MSQRLIQSQQPPTTLNFAVVISLFTLCIMIAYVLATHNAYLVTAAVMGVAFFTIGFLSPKISLYILIFSMLLSPEFGARDLSGRGFTIRFEDLLLVIMGLAWLAKTSVYKEIGLAVHTRLNIPILFYVLTCMFATALGIIEGHVSSPLTGILFVMKYLEYFFVYFIVINNITSKSQIKSLLWAMFLTYIIIIITSFSQIPGGRRITAPFEGETGEPNTLGGYLLIMFSLNVSLFFNVKKFRHKVALGTLAILCFVAILYTLSRATWLGLAVMYFAFLFFFKKNQRHVLLLAVVIGAIIAPLILPDTVINRFLYTFKKEYVEEEVPMQRQQRHLYNPEDKGYDSSTEARLNSMKQALRDLQRRPILGYGVTGYEFLDAQYHRILVETGVIGLVAFLYLLWMTGSSLFHNWKQYRDDPMYHTLTVGTLCAFLGLLAHSVGTNTFIIVRIMEPFWCLVGINMAIPIIEKDVRIVERVDEESSNVLKI